MWEPIAKEMGLPWKAVEAIYWKYQRERTTIREGIRRNKGGPSNQRAPPKGLILVSSGLHSVTETAIP